MEEKPTYNHYCEGCRFVGTYKDLGYWEDLYLCSPYGEHVRARIAVVRSGNAEDTYGIPVDERDPVDRKIFPAAAWGVEKAKSKGML